MFYIWFFEFELCVIWVCVLRPRCGSRLYSICATAPGGCVSALCGAAGGVGPNRRRQMLSTQQLWGSGMELIPQDCLGGCGPSCWFSPRPDTAVVFEVLVCLPQAGFLLSLGCCCWPWLHPSIHPPIHLPWLSLIPQAVWLPALRPRPPRHSPLPHSLPPPTPSLFLLCCSPAAPTQHLTDVIWMFICTSAPSSHPGLFKVVLGRLPLWPQQVEKASYFRAEQPGCCSEAPQLQIIFSTVLFMCALSLGNMVELFWEEWWWINSGFLLRPPTDGFHWVSLFFFSLTVFIIWFSTHLFLNIIKI